jgi:hypothetical protein
MHYISDIVTFQGCMHRGNAVEWPDASLQTVAVHTLCRFTANSSQTKASQYQLQDVFPVERNQFLSYLISTSG